MISTDPWVWCSALLTLCSLTLLYGDNPFFRIGEYTYTATVVAHSVVTGVPTLRDRFTPLWTGENYLMIVPFILGIMACFVIYRKYAWVASIPYALFIGVGTGLGLRSTMNVDIVGNLQTVMKEAGLVLVGHPSDQLGYAVRIIFTLTGMVYLFFTLFHKGPLSKPIGYVMTVGKYAFLIYLGLSVGNAIMQISGLATSAINRLIRSWLGL